ncbi:MULTISPECIES: baseplate J/gp47 family protein [unclassified Clostridium]|uniref:baseplate J/gp47 family protein n=1 Tax=unclassified Clostridium TaxID=2614128 RepID=UPI00029742A7|nr:MULTISPECIES: baseplate J/gp47 family protein [unclassified Clostridium]EKQ56260.1 MAG: putative phage Mu protein gp47-like protein [Clostridium sp. Maddingley MBC34-26]
MAYFAPYIDDTGFHMPTYSDIKAQLISDAKSIFGFDIYLEADSQDYQWIATVSEKIYDAFQIAQKVYNNRSPATAVGSALDSIVKINGIKRQSATYSTCTVTISGVAGTVIKNGIVLDKGSIKWDLPSVVTISDTGTIDVIATCEIAGPIVANAGDLINIYNPVYGWNGVYNSNSATLGSDVETNSALRKRQSQSTAQPSRTLLEGTAGAIAQLNGVTRSKVYENDTGQVDARGLPAHSITCVVEGGNDEDIANAIFLHKGPGCYTNGNVTIDVTDIKGQVHHIRFFRPTYVDITSVINIKALSSYTTVTTSTIESNIQAYLNSMDIGSNLAISSLWGVALQAMPNLADPMFSVTAITASRLGGTQGTQDITIAFNEVCRGNINYITANVS